MKEGQTGENWAEFRIPPKRIPNRDKRSREYLFADEVKALAEAAKQGRQGFRDYMIIMTAYRHGLRVSEIMALEWRDVEVSSTHTAQITIFRSKNGRTAVHPLEKAELSEFRKYKRMYGNQKFVFQTELKTPMSRRAVNDILYKACKRINFPFKVSSHMLRHSRGYLLVNQGKDIRQIQAWLGHKSIQSTQIYTEVAHETLRGLGCDG